MRRGRIAALAVTGAVAATALLPAGAAAHPLGNFSVNHLSQVRISEDRAEVHYILDQAEIPTFQETQRFDTDGDGRVTGAERAPLLGAKLGEIAPNLELLADGRPVALGPARNVTLTFPEGQGGLLLTRVEVDFVASLPAGAQRVELPMGPMTAAWAGRRSRCCPARAPTCARRVPATDSNERPARLPPDLL